MVRTAKPTWMRSAEFTPPTTSRVRALQAVKITLAGLLQGG